MKNHPPSFYYAVTTLTAIIIFSVSIVGNILWFLLYEEIKDCFGLTPIQTGVAFGATIAAFAFLSSSGRVSKD